MSLVAPYRGGLVCVLAMCNGCAHIQEDHFFVPSSIFSEDWRYVQQKQTPLVGLPLDQRNFVVTGHRLAAGPGTILAVRRFVAGTPLKTDQASFEKLTVALPKPIDSSSKEVAIEKGGPVWAFYSSSSSSFPGSSGCFGYAEKGSIRIINYAPERIVARVTLFFLLASPGGWNKECKEKSIDQEFVFSLKPFNQLRPWDGKAGGHIYDETMATE